MKEKGYGVERLDRAVQREAGVLGASQISSDMKTLLEQRDQDSRAAEAIALFCNSIRKSIGAHATVLGGLGTLVFTGGIGERGIGRGSWRGRVEISGGAVSFKKKKQKEISRRSVIEKIVNKNERKKHVKRKKIEDCSQANFNK